MFEKLIDSSEVYRGRIIDVRVDRVRLDDGTETTREVVGHRGSAAIIALDDAGRILLVEQYRYPVGTTLWEVPAGRLEPGEAPAATAERELAEEAGLSAEHLELLLTMEVSPGYCTERMWVYLATGLGERHATPDEDERITRAWFPLGEAVTMCLYGQVTDAKTVAAVLTLAARRRGAASDGESAR